MRHRNEGPGGCVPWEEHEALRSVLGRVEEERDEAIRERDQQERFKHRANQRVEKLEEALEQIKLEADADVAMSRLDVTALQAARYSNLARAALSASHAAQPERGND